MSEPMLRIRNHHSASCGDPPIVSDEDPDNYIGYFENRYGEQWLFTCHRKTRKVELLPRQESFASLHILTRRASEGSEALPSLARRVSMCFFGARVIRGGDIDWNTVHKVENGTVEGLILNAEERAWLQACWRAVVSWW